MRRTGATGAVLREGAGMMRICGRRLGGESLGDDNVITTERFGGIEVWAGSLNLFCSVCCRHTLAFLLPRKGRQAGMKAGILSFRGGVDTLVVCVYYLHLHSCTALHRMVEHRVKPYGLLRASFPVRRINPSFECHPIPSHLRSSLRTMRS